MLGDSARQAPLSDSAYFSGRARLPIGREVSSVLEAGPAPRAPLLGAQSRRYVLDEFLQGWYLSRTATHTPAHTFSTGVPLNLRVQMRDGSCPGGWGQREGESSVQAGHHVEFQGFGPLWPPPCPWMKDNGGHPGGHLKHQPG